MRLPTAGADEMDDAVALGGQELGDEPPVAPLPGRLGAHEAGRPLGKRVGEGLLPLSRPHAGGVAPKRGHPEAAELFLTRLAAPAAAELDGVAIGDAGRLERIPKRALVELRVPTRSREAAHIDERLDVCPGKGLHELFERPHTMSDREDGHVHAYNRRADGIACDAVIEQGLALPGPPSAVRCSDRAPKRQFDAYCRPTNGR